MTLSLILIYLFYALNLFIQPLFSPAREFQKGSPTAKPPGEFPPNQLGLKEPLFLPKTFPLESVFLPLFRLSLPGSEAAHGAAPGAEATHSPCIRRGLGNRLFPIMCASYAPPVYGHWRPFVCSPQAKESILNSLSKSFFRFLASPNLFKIERPSLSFSPHKYPFRLIPPRLKPMGHRVFALAANTISFPFNKLLWHGFLANPAHNSFHSKTLVVSNSCV